jgi:hypothetical protein
MLRARAHVSSLNPGLIACVNVKSAGATRKLPYVLTFLTKSLYQGGTVRTYWSGSSISAIRYRDLKVFCVRGL